MRTVVFSDPDLRKLFHAFFVCTWKDLEGDPLAAGSPRVQPDGTGIPLARGRGSPNTQICIFTPDAKLIHVLTGWIDAEELKWEMAQALITYAAIQAQPERARSLVVWRQDRIQDAFVGKVPRKPTRIFGMRAPQRELKTEWRKPTAGVRRAVARQRKVVKRYALAPERKIQTRWLTGGKTSGGFPGDGTPFDVGRASAAQLARLRPPPTVRPMPWDDMPEDLRLRFAAALGVEPPAKPATPRKAPKKTARRTR